VFGGKAENWRNACSLFRCTPEDQKGGGNSARRETEARDGSLDKLEKVSYFARQGYGVID